MGAWPLRIYCPPHFSEIIILSKLRDRGSLGCEKRCLWVPRVIALICGCDPRVGDELATMTISLEIWAIYLYLAYMILVTRYLQWYHSLTSPMTLFKVKLVYVGGQFYEFACLGSLFKK